MKIIFLVIVGGIILVELIDIYNTNRKVKKDLVLYEETKDLSWEKTQEYIRERFNANEADKLLLKLKFLRMDENK